MRRRLFVFVRAAALTVVGGMSACSRQPSDADGRKAVQDALGEGSAEYSPACGFALSRFEKTNGLASETDGVKRYALDFSADLDPAKPCCRISNPFTRSTRYGSCDGAAPAAADRATRMPPGSVVRVTGTVAFVKKETGWQRDNVRVLTSAFAMDENAAASASASTDASPKAKDCAALVQAINVGIAKAKATPVKADNPATLQAFGSVYAELATTVRQLRITTPELQAEQAEYVTVAREVAMAAHNAPLDRTGAAKTALQKAAKDEEAIVARVNRSCSAP